ncbi:MAG TPA: ABC transporter permease [Acidobacteriaceae bacterium]|jgi:putative ABC transport system permease protein|nr:ABC transporter permease [Acidobacteriaceae bacterium]
MSLWRQLTYGIRRLVRSNKADNDAADEVEQYFAEAIAAAKARGLSDNDARRDARLEIGNMTTVREQVRSFGWENAARTFWSDLHYAARQLRGHPGFTLVSLLTLAVGIGASTAIFSAVDPILFEPLPYPHASRVMMIWDVYQGARSEVSFGTSQELLHRSHSFVSMSTFEPWQPAMTGAAQAERLEGQAVSASFFSVLGVAPDLGRDFQPSDDVLNGPKVVVVSNRLWQRRFHGDPAVLGQPIKLDGNNFTIIGVMPRSFEDLLSPAADVWTPAQYDTRERIKDFTSAVWGNHLRIVGRLKPGISRNQAFQELDQIARTPWPEFPRPRWASLSHGIILDSLQDDMARTVRSSLLAVLGAVFLVLAIGCVNVTNLVLARSQQRRGEFSVRAALGASRTRILRQVVTENLLLALLSGVLGLGLAAADIRTLIALSPSGLPRLDAIALNGTAFAFAFGITALVGLLTGLIPALHISRREAHAALQQISRRAAGSHAFTRRFLVITEVALALVLLTGTGLLLHSMRRLLAVHPGFNPTRLLTLQVQTFGHRFDDLPSAPTAGSDARRRFFREALDAVRNVPGVEDAAFTSALPLSDDPSWVTLYGAHFEGDEPLSGRNVIRYAISSGYCRAMQIPVRRGRCIGEHDTATAPHVALLSESLARSRFPHQDPIGKRLHVGPDNQPWFVIVGVVGDVRQTSLALEAPAAVYLSTEQTWFADDTLSFVLRTRGDAGALAPVVKNAIWSVDRDQPIVRIATMDQLIAATEAQRSFILILFEAFGLVALALAAVGMYGVLAGSVVERTREIGVRAALGASRSSILALILRDGMRLTAFGILLGLCASAGATRFLITQLYGVSPLDWVTWLGVVALLGAVAAIACWAPAWRAACVDPSITLRAE